MRDAVAIKIDGVLMIKIGAANNTERKRGDKNSQTRAPFAWNWSYRLLVMVRSSSAHGGQQSLKCRIIALEILIFHTEPVFQIELAAAALHQLSQTAALTHFDAVVNFAIELSEVAIHRIER